MTVEEKKSIEKELMYILENDVKPTDPVLAHIVLKIKKLQTEHHETKSELEFLDKAMKKANTKWIGLQAQLADYIADAEECIQRNKGIDPPVEMPVKAESKNKKD